MVEPPSGPVSASAVQASRDVRVAFGRIRRRLREVATGSELSPSQASVLARVVKDDTASTSALARAEGVRPQSMAAIIASLEQLGLVTRSPDPMDGRRQILTPTDAGHEADAGNRQARQEWLITVIEEQCNEDERHTLIAAAAILNRLAGA